MPAQAEWAKRKYLYILSTSLLLLSSTCHSQEQVLQTHPQNISAAREELFIIPNLSSFSTTPSSNLQPGPTEGPPKKLKMDDIPEIKEAIENGLISKTAGIIYQATPTSTPQIRK